MPSVRTDRVYNNEGCMETRYTLYGKLLSKMKAKWEEGVTVG